MHEFWYFIGGSLLVEGSTVLERSTVLVRGSKSGTDTGGVNWVASHPPLALKLNFCFILLKE